MKDIKIGIIGAGNVGSAVIKLVEKNRDLIFFRSNTNVIIKRIVVKNLNNFDISTNAIVSTNIDDILNDDEISIVVELIGGVNIAYDIAKKSLENKKFLVTANKAMLAHHMIDLINVLDFKSGMPIYFEASVAGGIPVINTIRNGLNANNILCISGILNGTCNYIITKMSKENIGFDECLSEAKKLGYAESDPTLDISGMDAAYKLIILSFIAYGIVINPNDDILIEGIDGINQDDMDFANEFGYVIKPLALVKKIHNKIEFRVHLAMINKNEMLSNISGVMNGVSVVGDSVGETIHYGAGAGGEATASAIVSDIINITRNIAFMPSLESVVNNKLQLINIGDIECKYYLRLKVIDKVGAITKVSSILSANSISIETLLQRSSNNNALLLFSTHKSLESNIKQALLELSSLDIVCESPYMIRIENSKYI